MFAGPLRETRLGWTRSRRLLTSGEVRAQGACDNGMNSSIPMDYSMTPDINPDLYLYFLGTGIILPLGPGILRCRGSKLRIAVKGTKPFKFSTVPVLVQGNQWLGRNTSITLHWMSRTLFSLPVKDQDYGFVELQGKGQTSRESGRSIHHLRAVKQLTARP